eukprot:14114193-Ditylum_brightwellii.AAC.1
MRPLGRGSLAGRAACHAMPRHATPRHAMRGGLSAGRWLTCLPACRALRPPEVRPSPDDRAQ